MPISKYDRDSVSQILSGHGTWFTAKLMRLIATSDLQNRAKLAVSYPEEVKLVCEYLGHRVPSAKD